MLRINGHLLVTASNYSGGIYISTPPFKIEIIPKSKMCNKIGNTFLIPSMRETEGGGYQLQ